MTKSIAIPGYGTITLPVCYGLPALTGVVVTSVIAFVIWSYYTPPVKYTFVEVEQVGDGAFITLKLTKHVVWNRLCSGWAEQEIRPTIAVDNPKKISSSPIKLDGHVINTPKHKGANDGNGDPAPDRYIVIPQGVLGTGRWEFRITAKMACWPWEYIRPIESDWATAQFSIP